MFAFLLGFFLRKPLESQEVPEEVSPVAFVVHCKHCGKLQAASIARHAGEHKDAILFLTEAATYNGTPARRLPEDESLPDGDGWCMCQQDDPVLGINATDDEWQEFDNRSLHKEE